MSKHVRSADGIAAAIFSHSFKMLRPSGRRPRVHSPLARSEANSKKLLTWWCRLVNKKSESISFDLMMQIGGQKSQRTDNASDFVADLLV